MRAFEYASPTTAERAVRLLGADGALALAGGSDLLALVKDGVETPGRLVDLKRLAGTAGVAAAAGRVTLGATATLDDLAGDDALGRALPALAKAIGDVAAPQIRNLGTLGGNLCQRPRCWYFRRGFGLLAMADGRSMVIDGDNRFHAILGTDGPAYFVSPSTVVPLLVALGAEARVLGPGGDRTVPVAALYRVPQREGEREIALAQDEIVTAVEVPRAAGRRSASYEVRHRRSLDWSLATAAVTLAVEGGRVRQARVVLGQVAPVPWRSEAAEAELVGKAPGDAAAAARAASAAVAGARPLSRNRYKIQIARAAVERAVAAAAAAPPEAPDHG